jgi:hypothetical protein
MDGTYSIGELARRTGLTVKAIRLYSDRGIVLPIGRTAAVTGGTGRRRWRGWRWCTRCASWGSGRR